MSDVKNNYEKVRDLITEYGGNYKIDPEIGPIYSLYPEHTDIETEFSWPENSWPFANRPGVYIFLTQEGDFLYVGKASMKATLGRRLTGHFSHVDYPNDKTCKTKDVWKEHPFFVVTVSVREPYEAPSLEEYLIMKLEPKENTVGR